MSWIPEARRKTEDEKALTRFAEEPKPLGSLDAGSNQCDEAAKRASSIVAAPARESVSASDHFCRLEELQRRCAAPAWKPDPEKNVFSNEASFAACVEQFRTLRSRLYRLREKQSFRIVLVTSTLPGEGKTFVALNLAQAIARQHERRVLLIDADLRAAALHVAMGAPSWPGLSGCVLCVVRAASTAFDLAQTASQEFRGKNLLGFVLNRAEEQATYEGAYSYYGGNGS